jgi:hypothetical protein
MQREVLDFPALSLADFHRILRNKKRCRLVGSAVADTLRRGWDENLLLYDLIVNYLIAGVKRGYGLLLGERV